LAAYVDAGADLAGAVAYVDAGVANKDAVPAAARGDARQRLRDLAVLRDELGERRLAVDAFDAVPVRVHDPHVARGPGRRADHGVRPAGPPGANLRLVRGRVLAPARG